MRLVPSPFLDAREQIAPCRWYRIRYLKSGSVFVRTPKKTMKVITLAASKGGVGKTTLATALAVRAAQDYLAALLDLDPQESTSAWWERRKAGSAKLAENPKLFEGRRRDRGDRAADGRGPLGLGV